MKKIFILMAIANFSLLVYAPVAQAGLMEFFFPSLKEVQPDPSETLQAPFADETLQAERDIEKGHLPENAIDLDKPHRDNASIRDWVVTAVSEAMMFESADSQADLAAHKASFDASGWKEYNAFLEEKGITKVLQTKRFQVRSFVEDVPLILNEGAVGGSYRWLFEVPVMVSYLERDLQSYKNVEPVNQHMVVTVQVGRKKDAGNAEGILIEHWAGKANKAKK